VTASSRVAHSNRPSRSHRWAAFPNAISGPSDGAWVDLSHDLTPWAGKQVQFRFAYVSCGGVHGGGPFLDRIVGTADSRLSSMPLVFSAPNVASDGCRRLLTSWSLL